MDRFGKQAKQMAEFFKPLVAMIVSEIAPKKDEISTRKAYDQYGRYWVDEMLRRGNLTVRRDRNRVLLSVKELEILQAVERTSPTIITNR